MTEAEAKTKWCPHAVASHTDPRGASGYARDELGLPADTFIHACIGSRCMAWRWSGAEPKNPPRGLAWSPDDDEPGAPEPTRPDTAKDWPYTPVSVDESGDIEGGFWEEPEPEYAARCLAAKLTRPGYCGLAGQP